ncbi:hypothetical protein POTOM_058835 [Populus tomentosa]|uniref:Neprosin PEP catalytic domain-containing protein n=1 Tax=Populus tomentosa TaxID=118781 RepID=A0A8X8C2K4_POPTO|nr:hypothetical protein POTOM_058835 [Populus tomentosa]
MARSVMRKIIKLVAIVLTAYIASNGCVVNGRSIHSEDVELEKELAAINKPSIKTIETEYGDIYDCVDINKQPAFDHPLLKDHKAKTRPSLALEKILRASRKDASLLETNPTKIGLEEGCTAGSVPLRRATKEDLRRAKSSFKRLSSFEPSNPGQGYDFAGIVTTPPANVLFKGIAARMSVYQPPVSSQHSSTALIQLQTQTETKVGSIQVGWTIDPELYGDSRARLFTKWSEEHDGTVDGCYNTLCSGFVVTNPNIPIDTAFNDVSIAQRSQVFQWMMVTLDPLSQDWWLSMQDDNIRIGYWPRELFSFSGFSVGGYNATWGGLVHTGTDVSPAMGSGIFEDGNYNSTCNMVKVQVNIGNTFVSPYDNPVQVLQSRCFEASKQNTHPDCRFQFGGPGGLPNACVA